MRLLGSVNFAAYVVPLARLQARELQVALWKVYKPPRNLLKQVTLPPEGRHNLLLWRSLRHCSRPLGRPSQVIMATGASKKGWGASLHSSTTSGPCAQPTHQLSRNVGCQESAGSIPARAVGQVRGYPDRQDSCCLPAEGRGGVGRGEWGWVVGGEETTTRSCHVLPARSCCGVNHHISLLPVYVRVMANTIADSLSRNRETQWFPSPVMAAKIIGRYGTPERDLFTSRSTAQLPRYMTLDRGDSQVYDAPSQQWEFQILSAFPPPTLVPTVVNELRGPSARMLLIAPSWNDAPWLPVLLELLADTPRRLHSQPELLINISTGYPVKNLANLRLVVWPPCGKPQDSPFHLLHSATQLEERDKLPRPICLKDVQMVYRPACGLGYRFCR